MKQGPVFKPSGFARLATITKVDTSTMSAYVTFRPDSPLGNDGANQILAQLPISYLSSGGGFIGGYPSEGTPVWTRHTRLWTRSAERGTDQEGFPFKISQIMKAGLEARSGRIADILNIRQWENLLNDIQGGHLL